MTTTIAILIGAFLAFLGAAYALNAKAQLRAKEQQERDARRVYASRLERPVDDLDACSIAELALDEHHERENADIEKLEYDREKLESERDNWKRRYWEQVDVVQKYESQRDEWRGLFYRQGAAHQEGKSVLEQALATERAKVRQLVTHINELRKKHDPDAKPMSTEKISEITDPPIGTTRAFFESLKRLSEETQAWAAEHAPPDPEPEPKKEQAT